MIVINLFLVEMYLLLFLLMGLPGNDISLPGLAGWLTGRVQSLPPTELAAAVTANGDHPTQNLVYLD